MLSATGTRLINCQLEIQFFLSLKLLDCLSDIFQCMKSCSQFVLDHNPISMGNLYMMEFLKSVDKKWKKKYIKRYVAVSGKDLL